MQAQATGLRLETEIPEHAPFVTGDIALIERVLESLVENAVRYTPDGGVIRLAVIPGGDRLTVTVADTGGGIPEDDLPHIFERFYRVETSRSQGPEGTGLGLAAAPAANAQGQGFDTPPPLQSSRPVVYVTSQGLFYDSIVVATLAPMGPFQKLEMSGGLETEFGRGDRGYLGGRWWVDVNGNDEMDSGDMYFLCPLLAPGRETE